MLHLPGVLTHQLCLLQQELRSARQSGILILLHHFVMLMGQLPLQAVLLTPLGITGQPFCRIHGIMRIDGVDIHGNATNLQAVPIKGIEKGIFLHALTAILQENVKVAALMGLASGTAADNGQLLHADILVGEVLAELLLHIVLDHLLHLILGIVLQSLDLRTQLQGIHPIHKVIEHAVCHLFLGGILYMQEVGNGIPELTQDG